MKYITTYTGKHFYPTDPNIDDIDIEDIAHAMSLLCRANGHFKEFFSVAQHSINCAKEAKARGRSKSVQLACLLHDASEAFISDVTRPVKAQLPQYLEIEEKLQGHIYNKYMIEELSDEDWKQVEEIDDAMLYYEFLYFMGERVFLHEPVLKSNPNFNFTSFAHTKKEYLNIYKSLTGENNCLCVGIDASKGGWIAVAISNDDFNVKKFSTIKEVCSYFEDADIVIIDIPIGLPEREEQEEQRPDAQLRKLLKGKASSVFNTPCRQAIYETSYEKARNVNEQIMGKSLGAPSYGFSKAIKEVDEFLYSNPKWINKLLESHLI